MIMETTMRGLSFILAFTFVLSGVSLAGSSDTAVPNAGLFAYNPNPVVFSAPLVMASR
jgi:hypothetical protein